LPYKIFDLANWDEIYQVCSARRYGRLEEYPYGDVWQRFVKLGDKKILNLPGRIENNTFKTKIATSSDVAIDEETVRVFPLYEEGYCTVAVIGIETDGTVIDEEGETLPSSYETNYTNPKGTITF
jgi:hypothetical protein